MGAGASVAENADAGNQGKRPAGSTSNVNNGRRRRIEEKGGESRSLDPDVSRPRPQARALDRLSSRVLGFNKQSDDEGDDETESVIPERTRTEGQTSLAKGSSLDLRTVPSANFTSTSSSKVTDARLADKAEVLRQTDHFGLGASSSTASGEADDDDSGLGDESLAQLEACVRQSRLLLFSTHRSKDKDHCKGAGQCVRDTERALADYENGGSASSGRRRRSRKREREVRALCDAIKLHVLARLWQKVYGLLRAGEDQSISGSLAGGVLDLLESNLSVATGSAFTQWSVLPVKKYVRQLRDGLRLEEACRRGAGGQRANRSGISDETEIQRALELFNFNLDNDKKLHRKSLASSSSWEESAKHSVLWSAVTERRLVSLSRAAERDVRALRLEDELKRLLAKGSRSETDIAIEVGGTHTAEDSKGSVLGLKSPVLSLRELQSLLKSGEELLSSYAVDGKTKSPARLRPLLAVGEALLRCRCALERRGLRQKYDWPGFWLGDDADHFRALRGAEEMMRRAMWSLLGLPDSSKQSLLECGRQVYEWMRVNYGVQLRWDLEKTEHALGEFGKDGIFGFDGNRSKTLRLAFVESSAVVIQTAFRAYRARRDVNEALSRQRERLRMVKDNDGAAVVIQRHARKMLSRKRCEAMREEAEEEDRLSIKRFTQMSPSRLLRALLEEMGQNQGVSEPSRSNQGQDWKTRDTPFELARLVLKTSPVSEICRAFELCPRICWDKCALLLEEAPASLAVAVLKGITRRAFAVEVLMSLPVLTQARVLLEMEQEWREELICVMEDKDVVDLASSFAQSEESRNLGVHMLETCWVLGRLERVGKIVAQRGLAPKVVARLVEYLRPYSMLQITLGIKQGIKQGVQDEGLEKIVLEEMLSGVTKGALMLINTMVTFHERHGPEIFASDHNPNEEALDFTRGLNTLLHGLRCNDHLEHALAGLRQVSDKDEISFDSDSSFHRQAMSVLVKQLVYTVSLDGAAILVNWISKHHELDLATILHALSSDYPDYCSSVLGQNAVDLGLVSRGLARANKPKFACLIGRDAEKVCSEELVVRVLRGSGGGE